MNRHVRNIIFGLIIGGAAAVISIALISNDSSPDAREGSPPDPTVRPTATPAVEQPATTTIDSTAVVIGTVSFDPAQEATPVPLRTPLSCGFSVDAYFARSVEELYDISFIAVLARAERVLGAEKTLDTSEHLSYARVYELSVSEYFKRSGPDTIEFLQMEGSFRRSDLSPEVLEDFSLFESQVNCFNVLEVGQEYVLFLRPRSSNLTQYLPINDPHRFALINGNAILDGNLKQAVRETERDFPKMTTEELLGLLRSLK